MRGVVFKCLKKFVLEQNKDIEWWTVLEDSNLVGKLYYHTQSYSDDEMTALIGTIAG